MLTPFADRDQFSLNVGVEFSEDNLYTRQSSQSNLEFHRRLRRLPKKRVSEVLAEVGLADQADKMIEKLSSTLVRRLAFGRAILQRALCAFTNGAFREMRG